MYIWQHEWILKIEFLMGKVRNRMRSINQKHSYKLKICAHKTIIHFYKSTNAPKDKH